MARAAIAPSKVEVIPLPVATLRTARSAAAVAMVPLTRVVLVVAVSKVRIPSLSVVVTLPTIFLSASTVIKAPSTMTILPVTSPWNVTLSKSSVPVMVMVVAATVLVKVTAPAPSSVMSAVIAFSELVAPIAPVIVTSAPPTSANVPAPSVPVVLSIVPVISVPLPNETVPSAAKLRLPVMSPLKVVVPVAELVMVSATTVLEKTVTVVVPRVKTSIAAPPPIAPEKVIVLPLPSVSVTAKVIVSPAALASMAISMMLLAFVDVSNVVVRVLAPAPTVNVAVPALVTSPWNKVVVLVALRTRISSPKNSISPANVTRLFVPDVVTLKVAVRVPA